MHATLKNKFDTSPASVALHASDDRAQASKARVGTRTGVYYDRQWRRARAYYLAHNPLCVHCLAIGRTTTATDVDHVVPHKGSYSLFWDAENWQPLCKPCHSRKTADDERPKPFKSWFDPTGAQ